MPDFSLSFSSAVRCAIFGGIFSCIASTGKVSSADAAIPVEVTTAQRSKDVSRTFSATGTVTSRRRAQLSSRTTGLVQTIAVDAGSRVEKGDTLAKLDPKLAEIELDLIRAEIEGAEVELEDANRRVEEVKDLIEKGSFARSEARSLEATARIKEVALKRLKVAEIQQIERIDRHLLVAPFSGSIAVKMTEEGEWVDTGTPVLELVEMDHVWFDIQVPQEFLAPIRDAEGVTVILDAYPDKPLQGSISVVVPVKDNVSRTFLTRFDLDDPDDLAAPGMSGSAKVSWRSSGGQSVRVPRDAIVRFPDGSAKVWIVEQVGDSLEVKSRIIRTAGALGESAEVVEGLAGGETVVVRGNEGLQEGQKVNILEMKLVQPEIAP
jgi:RND family efflux transporter MFP subunit